MPMDVPPDPTGVSPVPALAPAPPVPPSSVPLHPGKSAALEASDNKSTDLRRFMTQSPPPSDIKPWTGGGACATHDSFRRPLGEGARSTH